MGILPFIELFHANLHKHFKMTAVRPVWTSDEGTMAQETAKSRWTKIVSGMIDDVGVEIAVSRESLPRRVEGRAIVQQLNALKKDIENNAALK